MCVTCGNVVSGCVTKQDMNNTNYKYHYHYFSVILLFVCYNLFIKFSGQIHNVCTSDCFTIYFVDFFITFLFHCLCFFWGMLQGIIVLFVVHGALLYSHYCMPSHLPMLFVCTYTKLGFNSNNEGFGKNYHYYCLGICFIADNGILEY